MSKNKLECINARLSEMQVGSILDLLGSYVNVKELMTQAQSAKGVAHGGCVAGQAVASAVQDLYFGGRGGVYNDVDCFLPTSSDKFEGVSERNRVRTVQMAQVVGEPAYGQLEASVLTRYKVLASSRQDKLNVVNIEPYCRSAFSNAAQTWDVIKSFDFNCVQVGIDLVDGKLVWTPAFARFLASRQIEVESTHTPAHTAIRLAKKLQELPEVYADTERVFRTLAGAIMRQKVAEASGSHRDKHQDPLVQDLAKVVFENFARAGKGVLYAQRFFGEMFAQRARVHEATLGDFFTLRKEGPSGRIFTFEPKVLPDEAFLKLASRRHVAEYAQLASVFLRPHKPEVRARGAALLRVDPVSLMPLAGGPTLWPAHPKSSVLEMAHEKSPIGEMEALIGACAKHHGFMVRIQARQLLSEQIAVSSVVQKAARRHGSWVYGVFESDAEVYEHPVQGFAEQLEVKVAEAQKGMLEQLVHRRLTRSRYRGVLVRELVTKAECLEEGEQLHHCIGGYAQTLKHGRTALISLRGSDKDPATWSSAEVMLGNVFAPVLVQHHGVCNGVPCEANREILKQVMHDLAVGEFVQTTPWLTRLSGAGRLLGSAVMRWKQIRVLLSNVGVRRSSVAVRSQEQEADAIPW